MEIKIGSLAFFSNFDSGNLAKVERVKRDMNGEVVQLSTTASTSLQEQNCPGNNIGALSLNSPAPDFEYNIWTSPDCAGTPYENSNRTWFYFGVKGGQPGKVIKFNLMNLNKQGKLYNQGMAPFVKVLPGRNKWERIRERPSYEIVDGHFQLSFVYRFPDYRNIICYFAFCYPYSYEETQAYLEELDNKFKLCPSSSETGGSKSSNIYYHRELLCKSIDNLRVDLLTVTSFKGMLEGREPRLDGLFPDTQTPRANQFQEKKVFVLTSRVHPGETPSSYVFKGFLDFITRVDDPRSAALRDRYVFKLIPLLNPDGVKRGHYRTDQRGVNLNRVYLDPCRELHPSIYAAKALLAYHYDRDQVLESPLREDQSAKVKSMPDGDKNDYGENQEYSGDQLRTLNEMKPQKGFVDRNDQDKQNLNEKDKEIIRPDRTQESNQCGVLNTNDAERQDVPCSLKGLESSEGSDSACDIARNSEEYIPENDTPEDGTPGDDTLRDDTPGDGRPEDDIPGDNTLRDDIPGDDTPGVGCHGVVQLTVPGCSSNVLEESSRAVTSNDECKTSLPVEVNKETLPALLQEESNGVSDSINYDLIKLNSLENTTVGTKNPDETLLCPPFSDQNAANEVQRKESDTGYIGSKWVTSGGLGFYVDLHGHASKRGCFMYGNYIEDEDKYVQCLLFPKLISVNSAHFDFTACNFSEKNMYSRDKRDGMSKEGSGRVATYKMTGLPYCYTLECNYNSGRSTNAVPPATCDAGRATPPPPPGFPPRYTPEIFEEVGRAVAISALDMVNANPWSRLPTSEHGCLEGVRNWVYRYVRSNKKAPAIQKKTQRVAAKMSNVVTYTGPAIHRPLFHKVSFMNSEIISQNGNDNAGMARNVDRIGIAKPRSSMHNMSNNKKTSGSNGASRNQGPAYMEASSRTKDQGRKQLDVAKTAPLLMLSGGDCSAHQLRLERNNNKFDKHTPFTNFVRQKSNVIRKLRENLASMRTENQAKNTDVNGNNDIERRKGKLRNMVTVKQLDCANDVAVADSKSEIFSESEPKEGISEKESSRILKRPLMSRRRKSKRAIRKESSKMTCDVVNVKSFSGQDVPLKNSSQVSL